MRKEIILLLIIIISPFCVSATTDVSHDSLEISPNGVTKTMSVRVRWEGP
jgi:hypothetical protein